MIAVGATVVRALETVSQPDGSGRPRRRVDEPRRHPRARTLGDRRPATGLHEAESSHLEMLRAAAGEALLERSYDAAHEHGYRWHEFGDSQLILP